MTAIDIIAKSICRETCAFMGEPPCWSVDGEWPNPNCDEPGCFAKAVAVLFGLNAAGYDVRKK